MAIYQLRTSVILSGAKVKPVPWFGNLVFFLQLEPQKIFGAGSATGSNNFFAALFNYRCYNHKCALLFLIGRCLKVSARRFEIKPHRLQLTGFVATYALVVKEMLLISLGLQFMPHNTIQVHTMRVSFQEHFLHYRPLNSHTTEEKKEKLTWFYRFILINGFFLVIVHVSKART